MCMNNSKKIKSKDVPKYGYKILKISTNLRDLRTPFYHQPIDRKKWNTANTKKITGIPSFVREYVQIYRVHRGRLSVFASKKGAFNMNGYNQVWKVEIKQVTKHAYKGEFGGYITYAVDQIKLIQQVWK